MWALPVCCVGDGTVCVFDWENMLESIPGSTFFEFCAFSFKSRMANRGKWYFEGIFGCIFLKNIVNYILKNVGKG